MVNSSSQPVLVLGMHRSGTSFLASLLQDMGLFLGDELLGAGKGNPRGHFEALPMLKFHQELIEARGGWKRRAFDRDVLVGERFEDHFSESERATARDLLQSLQREGHWGWKEPRTCLFLPLWQELLPQAKSIAVYRHPLEVHYSLLRREHWDLPLFPDQAMRAYCIYNQRILEWPTESRLLFNANAGFADLENLTDRIQKLTGLREGTNRTQFHKDEFSALAISRPLHRLFSLIYPEAAAVFASLQSASAMPFSFVERPDDDQLEAIAQHLEGLLSYLPAAARSRLGPVLDALAFPQEEAVLQQYEDLAMAVADQAREAVRWNKELSEGFVRQQKQLQEQTAENQRIWKECETLAEGYNLEHAEKMKLMAENKKIWDELVWTGGSWHKQRDYIQGLEEKMKGLEAEITQLREIAGKTE